MRTPWQKYFWLAVYFLSPFIPISIILRVRAAEANDPVYVISMILGVCAFMWLVNQIMLSARPRFLERYFGMDRIYRFHSLMAVVSISLAIMHFIFKRFVIGITVISGLVALSLFVFGAIFSLLFHGRYLSNTHALGSAISQLGAEDQSPIPTDDCIISQPDGYCSYRISDLHYYHQWQFIQLDILENILPGILWNWDNCFTCIINLSVQGYCVEMLIL